LIAREVNRLVGEGRLGSLQDSIHSISSSNVEDSLIHQQSPTPIQFEDSTHPARMLASGRDANSHIQFHLSFQSRVGPVQWLKYVKSKYKSILIFIIFY
jgi:hypothetical protein